MSNMPASGLHSLLTTLILATACLIVTPNAQATVACEIGTHEVVFAPGVTNTPQPVDVSTESNWLCVRLGELPLLVEATSAEGFTAPFSCQALVSPGPAALTVHWGDGGTSTYSFSSTVAAVSGNLVITSTGEITAGRYKDRPAVATFTLINLGSTLSAACAGTGVTYGSGPSTFTIL